MTVLINLLISTFSSIYGSISVGRVTVRVGSSNQYSGGQILKLSNIILHPKFSHLKNNIAILILDEKLSYSDRVQSASMAKDESDMPTDKQEVDVAGWGEQMENSTPWKLNYVTLLGKRGADCKEEYAEFDDSLICLGHPVDEGDCYGDIGNGAFYEDTLVGVCSFLVGACGGRYSDMFSNVAYYNDWIMSVLKDY